MLPPNPNHSKSDNSALREARRLALKDGIARVVEVDGELVLVDPAAEAIARALAKHACRELLIRSRVQHFVRRIAELQRTPADVVVVVINVDDALGAVLADALMPGHDWQAYRDRGQLPVAQGLAERAGIQSVLEDFDPDAAAKLREEVPTVAAVVFDHGVAEVYRRADWSSL